MQRLVYSLTCASVALLGWSACGDDGGGTPRDDHGAIAEGIMAPLGEMLPLAGPAYRDLFEHGRRVANHRFSRSEGLGPAFNVTFCASCHEKPVTGGSAGLYRNFFLAGTRLDSGEFAFGNGAAGFDCGDTETPPTLREVTPPVEVDSGVFAGVVRKFYYGEKNEPLPQIEVELNVFAQRNPIPFFGAGLLSLVDLDFLLSLEDEDDADGDGISGRINRDDRSVPGRFGRKAQTSSLTGFIRGPLFNHLGVTSDPISLGRVDELPLSQLVPSSVTAATNDLTAALVAHAQAAAPVTPNCDTDAVMDPEISPDDLFALVSFSQLVAAPELEPLNDQRRRGLQTFDELGCDSCHRPRLKSAFGPLPVYSDLLLHDMGPDLADGLEMGRATGSEFRTQPLWGLSATGPYLHDGRAITMDEAIRWHGGEAENARVLYEGITDEERADLLEFLSSLGGRSQFTPGLIAPDAETPAPGELGGPREGISEDELNEFEAGRALFDFEFGFVDGVGAPRFNGDSCRACHFEPEVGGAGPRGVNVMRHAIRGDSTSFVAPTVGTILHKVTSLLHFATLPQPEATVFEQRQTPALFGLGLIDELSDEVIMANADPGDENGDGISGRVSIVDGGRIGRFGWKAQVPSLREFVRDAVGAELGMTLPAESGQTFGILQDNDDVGDPELDMGSAELLESYMRHLAPPKRLESPTPELAALGEQYFADIGCTDCHIPSLNGPSGPVNLYSDLLLHEILPEDAPGIEDTAASIHEFRTAPLWGISRTGPYMHSGAADTLEEAILLHDGEARAARERYLNQLTTKMRAALVVFLETL